MKRLLLSIIALIIVSSASADGYKYARNISYRPQAQDDYTRQMCNLDVAYTDDATNAPVIVWFHGGGLSSGKKAVPKELMHKPIIVVGVEYRLLPNVTTDDAIDDAAAAVAWVFDNIEQYGGSASKIYIAGHSAGGYLVDMVGLDSSRLARYGKDADKLAGIIPFSGQVITHFATREKLGMSPLQPFIDASAPLHHMRKDCAPMLILSGDREMELYGRYEESAYFWRLMKLVGHKDVTLLELQGYGHGDMPKGGYPLAVKFVMQRAS